MKKSIASILVFAFTLQISAPSFAESSPEAELQSFLKCINQLSKNNKIFETDLGLGENANQFNLAKGVLLSIDLNRTAKNALIVEGLTALAVAGVAGVNYAKYRKEVAKGWTLERRNQFRKLRNFEKRTGITLSSIIGATLVFWALTEFSGEPSPVGENDQELSSDSIRKVDTVYGLEQMLTSDTSSAAKFRREGLKTCEDYLDIGRYYGDSVPSLLRDIEKK